jgi:hypothetical protein
MGSFKQQFLALPPGVARERLIYEAALAQGKPKNLVPVTVPAPGGGKITYYTLPDYLSIDGMRVPMAPATAQKLANHWGMVLPTPEMSKQIYQAADTKVRATPLSATGYTGKDGRRYTGKDVISRRIGASDAAVKYNEETDEAIARAGGAKGLIAGQGKDILENQGNGHDPVIGGWAGAHGDPLQPYTVAHRGEAERHSEYGLWTRLIDGDVEITKPDGTKVKTTMEKLRADPVLSKAVSSGSPIKQYHTGTSGKVDESSGEKHSVPAMMAGAPPMSGFRPLASGENNSEVGAKAKSFLHEPMGSVHFATINGKNYGFRVEPHFHPAPPPNAPDPDKYVKPWGWHTGVTAYIANDGTQIPSSTPVEVAKSPVAPTEKKSLLGYIDEILNQFG